MKKTIIPALALLFVLNTEAQQHDKSLSRIIKEKKVRKIEKALSADDLQGRGLFTPGIERAASFIAAAFREAGLVPLPNTQSFFQEFSLVETRQTSADGTINGRAVSSNEIMVFSSKESVTINESSGYEMVKINAGDRFLYTAYSFLMAGKNYIVCVDTAHRSSFTGLNRLKRPGFGSSHNVLFVVSGQVPASYSFSVTQEVTERKLKNVVGMLPGKSQTIHQNENVIFSAHYDHLGIGKPGTDGDSIYNGANDDAAGTTAVIMLAKYYGKAKNNERNLIFAAFTAEEAGGLGSQYFSKQFDPKAVVAMFNIEMIGTDSKWGKNSAYITGYEKTDMGKIMEKNLAGTGFVFHPDPYPDQQLFYRSDNATLARLGVPAHTISTSKMDSEPFYHTVDDEIETLDIRNMTEIIKAIALSARTIVSGADTPSRVDATQLK